MPLPDQTPTTTDPLAALKAAMADTYVDPQAELTAHGGGPVDPTNPRSAVNLLALRLAGPSEADLSYGRAVHDLQNSDPDYALSRQRDEILNEREASNEADARFGDQMATRALRRAVASKLGLSNAEDQSQLTQAHEQVVRNKGDEAMREAQPKYDAAHDAAVIKANADTEKASMAAAAAAGRISQAEYNAYVGAQAKVFGSPFAAQGTNLAPPPDTASPTAPLRAAVNTAVGSPNGARTFNSTQEGLIAKLLTSPGGRGKTRADAIAVLDRVKPQGWQ